jgi:hypothetical protein
MTGKVTCHQSITMMVANIVHIPGFRTAMDDVYRSDPVSGSNHHVNSRNAKIAPCFRLSTLPLVFRGSDMNSTGDTGIKCVDRSE